MSEIDPEARCEIDERLDEIANTEGVRFLLAIESGSRAWGFPSPDSDYDVRFIYVRELQDYVTLDPKRDVIERPIVDDFDVSGWDIRKALQLLLKHNAVVTEWINSPFRYLDDHPVVAQIGEVADRFFDPRGYALHYRSLAQNQINRWDMNASHAPAKQYFYALRPALSIRAMRFDSTKRPPMRLQDLMAVCALSDELNAEIDQLVELKATKREAADTKRSRAIESLIEQELNRVHEIPTRRNDIEFSAAADDIFRNLVLNT